MKMNLTLQGVAYLEQGLEALLQKCEGSVVK